MNSRALLDLLLKSSQTADRSTRDSPGGALGQMLGGAPAGALGQALRGGGKGALATGAMGLLLGGRAGRIGGKASRYGNLATLGMVAYKAFSAWQAQQQSGQGASEPQTVDRVTPDLAETHSRAILKAVVAASKADGHVNDRERALIEAELGRLANDPELSDWLRRELARPLNASDVAAAAITPEIAAEMYIASLLVVDEQQEQERAYLDELAKALRLEPALKERLEAEARAV